MRLIFPTDLTLRSLQITRLLYSYVHKTESTIHVAYIHQSSPVLGNTFKDWLRLTIKNRLNAQLTPFNRSSRLNSGVYVGDQEATLRRLVGQQEATVLVHPGIQHNDHLPSISTLQQLKVPILVLPELVQQIDIRDLLVTSFDEGFLFNGMVVRFLQRHVDKMKTRVHVLYASASEKPDHIKHQLSESGNNPTLPDQYTTASFAYHSVSNKLIKSTAQRFLGSLNADMMVYVPSSSTTNYSQLSSFLNLGKSFNIPLLIFPHEPV